VVQFHSFTRDHTIFSNSQGYPEKEES